jgi:hypothetical protein
MTTFMIVGLSGAVLMLLGAAIGVAFQDRVYEDRRRRMAIQRREINARWRAVRALQHGGAAFGLAAPGHQVILPLTFDADDDSD